MDTEFYNLYVSKILEEVGELNKTKLLLQTQVAYQEQKIQEMTELQNRLQQANIDLTNKLRDATSLEKVEKKASRKSKPETETETVAEGF